MAINRKRKPAIRRHMATPKMKSERERESSSQNIICGIYSQTSNDSPYFTERFREGSRRRVKTKINKPKAVVMEAFKNLFGDVPLAGASVVLSWAAVQTWLDFKFTWHALNKIRSPSVTTVPISGLRSLIRSSSGIEPPIAVVHGALQPLPTWQTVRSFLGTDVLEAEVGGGQTVKCLYEDKCWVRPVHPDQWQDYLPGSRFVDVFRGAVKFVIAGSSNKDFIRVDLNPKNPPQNLPCEILHPPNWFGSLNPFYSGLLYHSILPVGKEVTAIGTINFSDHHDLYIKPCDDLPYFLTDLTKDQMVQQLASKSRLLFLTGIVLVPLSLWVFSFACRRHLKRLN